MTSPLVPQRFSRLATTTVVPSPSLALTPTPSTSAAPPRTIGAALEPLLSAPSSIATRVSEKRLGPATGCPGSDDPEASDKRKREASIFNAGQVHSLKFPYCVTLFFILKYIVSTLLNAEDSGNSLSQPSILRLSSFSSSLSVFVITLPFNYRITSNATYQDRPIHS